MNWRPTARAGFTLIELLVATALLVLLSTVVIASFRSANRTSRDSKRKADLQQVRGIIENFRLENGIYPGAEDTVYSSQTGVFLLNESLDLSGYAGNDFIDPTNDATFHYRYIYRNLPGCAYEIGGLMEGERNAQGCASCYPSGSPPVGNYYCIAN